MNSTGFQFSDRYLSPVVKPALKLKLRECSKSPSCNKQLKEAWSESDLYTTEKDLVHQLNSWEKRTSDCAALDVVRQAKTLLSRRLNHQNSVEQTIKSRKRLLLSRCSSSPPPPQSEGLLKKLSFKEISNFHRMYEDDLQLALQSQSEKLLEVTEKRQRMRSELSEMREELKANQDDLETCRFRLEKLERNKKTLKKTGDAVRYFTRKTTFRDEIFKKEGRCAEISQELSREIKKNGWVLDNLDSESTHLRKEAGIFKEAILEHYKRLLEEGLDSRGDGLQWIVRKIWALGEKVRKSDFAEFLDEGLVESILVLAEKNRELEELLEKLSVRAAEKGKIFASGQEKLNEVQLRLAQVSKRIRIKKPELLVFENRKSVLTWENCSPGQVDYKLNTSHNLIEVQQRITTLRSEMASLKDNEIARLFRLCFMTGYEARKKVDLNCLISALVGYENTEKYTSLVIKLKRDLLGKVSSPKGLKLKDHI